MANFSQPSNIDLLSMLANPPAVLTLPNKNCLLCVSFHATVPAATMTAAAAGDAADAGPSTAAGPQSMWRRLTKSLSYSLDAMIDGVLQVSQHTHLAQSPVSAGSLTETLFN